MREHIAQKHSQPVAPPSSPRSEPGPSNLQSRPRPSADNRPASEENRPKPPAANRPAASKENRPKPPAANRPAASEESGQPPKTATQPQKAVIDLEAEPTPTVTIQPPVKPNKPVSFECGIDGCVVILDTKSGIATHRRSRHPDAKPKRVVTYPKTSGVKIKTVKRSYPFYKGIHGQGSRKPKECYGQASTTADDLSIFGSGASSLDESTDDDELHIDEKPPAPKKPAKTTTATTAQEPPTTPTPSPAPDQPEVSTSPLTRDAQTQTDTPPAPTPKRAAVMKFLFTIRDGEVQYEEKKEE